MAKIDPQNVTQQVTGAVGWRKDGIKHKKNEVFLDVIEKLNLLVARNGTILHSEILGTLRMKSFLSGMPELKLGLNDRILLENKRRYRGKMIEMDENYRSKINSKVGRPVLCFTRKQCQFTFKKRQSC